MGTFDASLQLASRALVGSDGRHDMWRVGARQQDLMIEAIIEPIENASHALSERARLHTIPASAIASVSARSRTLAPLPNHVDASRVLALWPLWWSL